MCIRERNCADPDLNAALQSLAVQVRVRWSVDFSYDPDQCDATLPPTPTLLLLHGLWQVLRAAAPSACHATGYLRVRRAAERIVFEIGLTGDFDQPDQDRRRMRLRERLERLVPLAGGTFTVSWQAQAVQARFSLPGRSI